MTPLLAYLNASIMATLSILHFYWAAGGQWGMALAVPSDEAGNKVLRISSLSCIAVGTGLLGFAFYYLSKAIARPGGINTGISQWVIWVLAFIFIARAIGDFRYVGFFKTMKNTAFGQMDTRWYAPLCLYLGLSSVWIGMNS